jgi:hemerythrin-like domain-containing protein
MAHIIEQLRRDHRNMEQLLDIIEREMTAYRDDEFPDFDLLRMIAEYTVNYPEIVHHPKENLLYTRLASRDPTLRRAVGDLIKEHQRLAEITQRLTAAIARVASDETVPRAWLDSLVQAYLSANRHHIMIEEQKVYPRALALLTRQEWAEIDEQAASLEDPVFGSKVTAAYLYLHKRITQEIRC